MSFWQSLWFVAEIFFFIAYLMVLFQIFADLFRDRKLNGWAKAIWLLFLIAIPLLTALVYLIARGRGMASRQITAREESRIATEQYIRTAAASSPADDIAKAKQLLDAGAITAAEFEQLKAAALAESK